MAQLKLRYPERKEEELHRTAEAMIIQNKLFAVLEGTPPTELKEVADGDVVIKDEAEK
jgi:hypothetical protein